MCEKLLNVNEVAEILRIHPLTCRRMVKRGILKSIKIPGLDRILFDRADIEELIKISKIDSDKGQSVTWTR
jgi:excisionase family DNA binding protein